jgi:hypothetical protein
VRTRTLLLLAIACGLVILAAGVVQLLRIAGQDAPATAAAVGREVQVADMTVEVLDTTEVDGMVAVDIAIGGVDDPDGSADFRLVVPGDSLAASGGSCGATTVDVQRCVLEFDLEGTEGSSRVLLYRRGDERVRWELGGA